MTAPLPAFGGFDNRLTLVRLRFHLLRYRYRGETTLTKGVSSSGGTTNEALASAVLPSLSASLEHGSGAISVASPLAALVVASSGHLAGSRNRHAVCDVTVDYWHNLVSGDRGCDPAEERAFGVWEDEGGAFVGGERRFRPAAGHS